ncbi:hypothetical protein BV22DRAFT_1052372, partial [Leucogyrophana mollusca]
MAHRDEEYPDVDRALWTYLGNQYYHGDWSALLNHLLLALVENEDPMAISSEARDTTIFHIVNAGPIGCLFNDGRCVLDTHAGLHINTTPKGRKQKTSLKQDTIPKAIPNASNVSQFLDVEADDSDGEDQDTEEVEDIGQHSVLTAHVGSADSALCSVH